MDVQKSKYAWGFVGDADSALSKIRTNVGIARDTVHKLLDAARAGELADIGAGTLESMLSEVLDALEYICP